MSNRILTTTGFLLPDAGKLYEVFESKNYQLKDFINDRSDYTDNKLKDYFSDNKISFSPAANLLYRNYLSETDYKSFIKLVDFAAEVLGKVPLSTFLEWQAHNKHIAKISIKILQELITHKLDNHLPYELVSGSARFVMSGYLTKEDCNKNMKLLTLKQSGCRNWIDALSPLMENKTSFCFLFKYMFVDNI